MNTSVAILILAGAILALSLVMCLALRQRASIRARVERERRERDEKEQLRKLKAEQKLKGEWLLEALIEAAGENHLVNVHADGLVSTNIGIIEIESLAENGKLGFTIVASIPDPSCATMGGLRKAGYNLFQVNINLEKAGCEIHVAKGPYGPECDYSIDDFNFVKSELWKFVHSFRMFVRTDAASDAVFTPPSKYL
ncbi:MAG: hypothetical protein KGJ13_05130 [Patescibacteria group bacterium]|nr:hypothetical protein [Patescibacteria group bacterium]